MALSPLALRLLDAIEAIEMRSLAWGFADGSLSEAEALGLLGEPASSADLEDALEDLIEARAVLEVTPPGGDIGIRSRFAESMRLLVSARQLFPGKPWQGAPSVVSDFRVDRRPRRFPKRDQSPEAVLAVLGETFEVGGLKRDLWDALTARPGFQLAGFQARSVDRILAAADDQGTIVTAGTGSGKTIAFYLPALIRIGAAISADRWVKAIAVYPRVELLKDQFAEAYAMAGTTVAPLAASGQRPMVLAALYGATPTMASVQELTQRRWATTPDGFICPWLRCPVCARDLVWTRRDLEEGRERLTCISTQCDGEIPETRIVLTRRRMQQHPPDVLFTTTEILNQRLSDHWMRGLFGIGESPARKPFLALLDEVHTYEGASGAQAALTLRRWRHLLGSPLSWVGLSATLEDAARFFSDLTGAPPDQVVEITPALDDFVEEGAEYQILLRGDAGSRSSLLSTTIQTAMLVSRLMDPPTAAGRSGAFGRRAFLFTDDLDVTNRLFDDLRDAEGLTIFGRIDSTRRPLAALRAGGADAQARDLQGQRWRAAEDIGHALERPLTVGRTTSQDGGVAQNANVIVATSTLEVGFNDPLVGAVIQHKAPRGMASFLQRKGRAGRHRAMRPFMLTVLSDYGRDRAFYQAYEHLFDPTLEPQHLPVGNPHILRIQAVYTLLDWLGARTMGADCVWVWDVLSRPRPAAAAPAQRAISALRSLLNQLSLGDPTTVDNLKSHLIASLTIQPATADSLLWEAPRSLLLEAVPTLLRRLALQWRIAFPVAGHQHDFQEDYHPLPDFIPRTLFSDLSLPEVRIITPPATVNHTERTDALPIVQALNQLAPGRVTRRLAFERGGLSHWFPVDPARPQQSLTIEDYAVEHEFVGEFRPTLNGQENAQSFLVFRPWTVRLEKAERAVALPTSNSRLSWRSDLSVNGDGLTVPISPRSAWSRIVDRIDFHLHRFRSSLSVRRFAPSADATVRTLTDDFAVTVEFTTAEGLAAAVGFEIEVDGFRVDLAADALSALLDVPLGPDLTASSRLSYLRDLWRDDPALPQDLNSFQRDWLFQILISAVMADASVTDRSLSESVADILSEDRLVPVFDGVMTTLFGASTVLEITDDEEESDDPDDEPPRSGQGARAGRLQQALDFHLADPLVRERLRALAAQMSDPDAATFAIWFRRLVLDSLGEALLQACIAASPRQATLDTLLVDVSLSDDGGATVWISETTLGGAGVLEAFAERFGEEPRAFFAAVEAAIAPTDLETVDPGLREILRRARVDVEISQGLIDLRATTSHAQRAHLWSGLSQHLSRQGGVDLSHALSVALNARLLRVGSGPDLDGLLQDLLNHWDALESRFGLSISVREFAYICSSDPVLSRRLDAFVSAHASAGTPGPASALNTVMNLLWPRAAEVRLRSLQSYNPYRSMRSTDPGILRHLLARRDTPHVNLADPTWLEDLRSHLRARGVVRLVATGQQSERLRAELVTLLASPVDVGMLQFFPALDRVDRMDGATLVTLVIREQL